MLSSAKHLAAAADGVVVTVCTRIARVYVPLLMRQ